MGRRRVILALQNGLIVSILDLPANQFAHENNTPLTKGTSLALTAGTRLGPYTIEAPAGAGGMGEVYRAKDTRLDRVVAIKVLPHGVADNPDVKARFEREAKTISSLNHPNICTLYDVGHQDGIDFLVMEYIEGQTLAERLKENPLPNQELFRISIQIADALDKAHRQGLVHRDLKPGNIMLTREGAKLLDFGLAKFRIEAGGMDQVSQVTRTTPLTGEGTIVGTLQYMAPEQLEGLEADARSDIFAFGSVLYEMATGRPAFSGSGRASLIASIMKELPQPISQIQPMSPPMLERAIMQCLEKDPDHRWQSAGDLKRSLQWISEGGSQAGIPKPVTQRRKNRERLLWAATAVLAVASVTLAYLHFQPTPDRPLVLSNIELPAQAKLDGIGGGSVVLSPDGLRIAFTAIDSTDKERKLWVRSLNSLISQALPGTNDAQFPFWSFDSRYLAFYDGKHLKKVLASGGPTLTLAPAVLGRGGDWNETGTIIYSPDQSGPLYKVSAAGGNAEPLTVLDTALDEVSHRWARFLPDNNHFLFFSRVTDNGSEHDAICLSALDSPEVVRLISCKSSVGYADGYILFVRDGTLMAQAFDDSKLALIGDAAPVLEDVVYLENWSRGVFSADRHGNLLLRQGTVGEGSQLRIYDTLGIVVDSIGERFHQFTQLLSPDQRSLAIDIFDQAAGHSDVWIWDLNRRIKTRLSFGDGLDVNPIWAPDGQSIAWISDQGGIRGVRGKSTVTVDSGQFLYSLPNGWLTDWTEDGRYHILDFENQPSGSDIKIVDLQDTSKSTVIISSPSDDWDATLSPDNRWLAYASAESGREEVYVTTFPRPTGKWQVSINEGDRPHWSTDGKRLYYLDNRDQIMKAEVNGTGTNFIIGRVEPMFAVRGSRPGTIFDVTGDGTRFYVNEAIERSETSKMILVQHWTRLLEGAK